MSAERTVVDLVPSGLPVPPGEIICVFGGKGGVGATTLAVNLAVSWARRLPRGAVLVDLDVQLGDALGALDLPPRVLLADLAPEAPSLGTPALLRRLPAHASGLRVISQDGQLDRLEGLDADATRELLVTLSLHFDAVVVDGLRDFGDLALAALDASSRVLLVVTPDVAALRRAGRCRQVFRRLEIRDQRLQLVINRHRKRRALPRALIAQALGLPITATIANDFPTVLAAIDRGAPLDESAPTARVTRDLAALALALLPPPAAAGRVSIWRRIFSRRRDR